MARTRSYFTVFAVLATMMALLGVIATSSEAAVGDTSRVNLDSSGAQASGGGSGTPVISADGRYVAFVSSATNLVEGDTNGFRDVFVRDRQMGTTERVSVRVIVESSGAETVIEANENTYGFSPTISADGRYVAFLSGATNLVEGDTNGFVDVFVYDRQTKTTQRLSVDSSGVQANQSSFGALSMSADGRFVAFASWASNLLPPGWDNISGDVFVRDRDTDNDGAFDEAGAVSTERVSWAQFPSWSGNGSSFAPSISSDGRYVAFFSTSSNLVAGDNDRTDVFVRDRQTGGIQRVRMDCAYNVCNTTLGTYVPSISADGRYVTFHAPDSNLLVANDNNSVDDVFVYDRQTGATQRVSVGGCATQANNRSFIPSISANGRYVVFSSSATNLVADDTNAVGDVFVRDLQERTTQRVSVGGSGTQANAGSGGFTAINPDGRYVAFSSSATNLVDGDTNGLSDVFVHERETVTQQPSDCIEPTSSASASTDSDPDYSSGTWTNEDVQVSLSAQDNEGGTGVKDLTYSATGTQPIASTTVPANQLPKQLPIINTEGTTPISYFATDNEGNQETPAKTFTVRIDRSAPSSSATATDSSGAIYTSGTLTSKNVTVSLNANDGSGSGIKQISYSINGGADQTYDPMSKIVVGSEGVSTISYFATDNAGNEEIPAKTFTVKLDKSAPTLDIDSSDGTDGITPDNREVGVSLDIEPTATFSEEMNPETINSSTIKLYQYNKKKKRWQPVTDIEVSCDSPCQTATLTPYPPANDAKRLAANKKYKVTVTTGAKDLAGLSMSSPKSWTFTTRNAA